MKKYIILSIFAILLTGCEKEAPLAYTNDPALYFTYETTANGQKDSINHSFFLIDTPTDTVWIKVSTMGETADADRPFSIIQTNSGDVNAAVAGTHFVSFSDPSISSKMIIPAGKALGEIPLVLKRDESLALSTVVLKLAIEANDFFRVGIPEYSKFRVKTTAMSVKPALWDTSFYIYFGTWGSVKMRFIIDHTGYMDWDVAPEIAFGNYLKSQVKQALLEYNAVNPGNKLKEADGTEVTFD